MSTEGSRRIDPDQLAVRLSEFGARVSTEISGAGTTRCVVEVDSEQSLAALTVLRDDESMSMRRLVDLMAIDRLGRASRDWLLDSGWIPAHLEVAYESVTDALLDAIADSYDRAGDFLELRIHGDCHRGNILWTDDGPHFVDLDDCVTGPAIQDLWMLLAGDDDEMRAQFSEILEGYRTFANLDLRQLWLVEGLRTLRIMHYAAWIARRWSDPAFPKAFPWFEETRYWEEHVLTLREQAALLQEPPLVL